MRIAFFANTDWYLYNFRRSLVSAARDHGYEVLLICPEGDYVPRLRALGFDCLLAPLDRKSVNPLRELRFLFWLARSIREQRVDLIHGFTVKSALYAGLVARYLSIPNVSAIAGLGHIFVSESVATKFLRPIVVALMRLAFGQENSRIVFQNPDDQALFLRLRMVDAENLRLIRGSGVDTEAFRPRLASTRESKDIEVHVLLPARMLWSKGVGVFVDAVRILKRSTDTQSAKFIVAGQPDPGNPESIPESQLKSWETEGLIEWLGHVDDMALLYQACDIVALPTYYGEGLPRSLNEAGACGLPLVTTNVPGCREAVEDGINGLVVPPRDPEALAIALRRLIANPEERAEFGASARAKVLAQFDEKIVIDRTLLVYDELLLPKL